MSVVFYAPTRDLDLAMLRSTWQASLTADESARLASLRIERDQRDYLAAHALLRLSLHEARGTDLHGAPSIDRAGWSLTHSDGFVACALADHPTALIGVDTEPLEAASRLETLLDTFLARAELPLLPSDPEARSVRMVEIWTAKEALLKALGQGFSGEEGFGVLAMLESTHFGTLDGWRKISVRDARSGAAYSTWECWVEEHVLAVVSLEGNEGIPRLTGVTLD